MSLLGSQQAGLEVRDHSGPWYSDTRVPGTEGGLQDGLDDEVIAGYGQRLAGLSEGRSLASDLSLHKIHSGLNTVGSIIRIVTTVLSLFGADNVDRTEGSGATTVFSRLFQLVTSLLQVGLSPLPGPSPASSLFSSKVGQTAGSLSQDQAAATAHQQQIQSFISSLTPAQLEAKRKEVESHVAEEATQQGLGEEETAQLLEETLLYNGLAQPGQAPASLQAAGGETVPGLPVPGTLEHSLTLALFNAQQFVNQAISGPFQPAVETKQGVSSGENQTDGSVVSAVSSLPASLSNAAVQVLKFVNPGSQEKTEPVVTGLRPGQSYSEVVTGVDPTYAALGVLTTGALASVAYSYVASDSDIASSASDLALGAVDAIARNDLVQNIANNDLIKQASNAIGSLTGSNSENDVSNNMRDPSYYYYDYDKLGYSDYDYYNQNYQLMDPKESFSKKDPLSEAPAKVEWYEPATGSSEEVPYVAYKEQHNPWALLSEGRPTDHLYRSLA